MGVKAGVWVAMSVINPEWQEPVAVYRDREVAIRHGYTEDDLYEVLIWE